MARKDDINRAAGFKAGEEEPAPLSFVKITVNQKIELRTTTYVPSRTYRVSTETAAELGAAVATQEEAIL